MRVIIAEDEMFNGWGLLPDRLGRAGYDVTAFADGEEACAALLSAKVSTIAVLDAVLPGLNGSEICRRFRATPPLAPGHLILLTDNGVPLDIVTGLEADADDYLARPFQWGELQARLQSGVRVLRLQERLGQRVRELEAALAQGSPCRGLLPMCGYCKRIRDDGNYWQQLEVYFARHTGTRFSHGICPKCEDEQLARFFKAVVAAA